MFSQISTMAQSHLPLPSNILSNSQLTTSLLIRGGSQLTQAETVDSIYIRSAVGYFNNLRVPAAVLMSIIMKEMFALQSTPPYSMRKWDENNGIDHSKRWRILRYTYLLLMVLAFSLETFTIFVATQVLTQLATAQRVVPVEMNNNLNNGLDQVNNSNKSGYGGGFFKMMGSQKEVHQSMIDFLIKNFEFEYTTCRLHFVTGLLSFTVATALRVRFALRKYRKLSMCGMCCLLTVASGMLTYTNANTISYGGYINLFKRNLELTAQFLKAQVRSGPLSTVTAFLACLTLVYAILGAVSPEFGYFEEDEKGTDPS